MFFLTVFLFMTIVLSNGYKGIVITDIIAPLSGRQHISTFEEALKGNYSMITPNLDLRNTFLDFQNLYQLNDTVMTYIWLREYKIEDIFIDSIFYKSFTTALKQTDLGNLTKEVTLLQIIRDLFISWDDRNLSILFNGTEYELMKCNKTILVDRSQELKTTFAQLSQEIESDTSRSDVRLSKGTEGILKQSWGIYVSKKKWDNGLLAGRMSHLIGSGIPNQFKEMERAGLVKYLGIQDVKSRLPSALNLNTNILTLFAVYAAGISLSLIWLSIEYCVNISPGLNSRTFTRWWSTL